MTDREKIVAIVKIAGLAQAKPNPNEVIIPADIPNALLKLFWNIVGYGALALAACLGADFVAASSIGGLGLGHNN